MRLAIVHGYLLLSCVMQLHAEKLTRNSESTGLTFAPPLMGYVFDAAAGQVRMLAGIPGAARVADPVKLDFKMAHAAIGAGGTSVVASVPDGASLIVVSRLDAQASTTTVENSMGDFDLAAFNDSGTAVIVYGSVCKCIQIIDGLPDAPHVNRRIDAASLPGSVQALALGDDASIAAVAVAKSEDGSSPAQIMLFDLRGDSAPRPVIIGASSLAFTPNGNDLAISGPDSGSVSLSRNGDGPVNVAGVPVEGYGKEITSPGAVAFAGDGLLLIADRAGFVHVVDLKTNQRNSVPCICIPDSMERLKEKSIYRLTGMETGAVWIFDGSRTEPRTVFVPVDTPADNTGAGAEIAQ